jgi:hypothetical protein
MATQMGPTERARDRVLGYRFGGPGSIPGTTRFSEEKKKRKK